MPIQFNGTGTITGVTSTIAQGATDVSSATTVTLTNASTQIQNITMTAVGQFVVLPSATTLGDGANTFIINNRGTTLFGVKDAAGTILLPVAPAQTQSVFTLLDNSTSAGKWASGTLSLNVVVNPANISTIASTGDANAPTVIVCALSATTIVLSYYTINTPFLVAATVSGSTITFGAPVTLNDVNINVQGIVAYSSTQFVYSYNSFNTSQAFLRAATVSGTTITLGTPTAVNVGPTSQVTMISPTVGVWSYNPNSSTQVVFRAFTLSGTTFTFGTNLTVSVTSAPSCAAKVMFKVIDGIIAYDLLDTGIGTNAKGFISNSGTTLTLGNTYSRLTNAEYFLYSTSPNTIVGESGVYTLTGSNTISSFTANATLPANNRVNSGGNDVPLFSTGVALLTNSLQRNFSVVYGTNGNVSGVSYSTTYRLGITAATVLNSSTGVVAGYGNGVLQASVINLSWT
jgi:hypothetical protein